MFRAHEPAGTQHDRLVAVKVFRLDLTPEQAGTLVAELNALVAADIKHPNIAAPIAAGLEHGTPYLAQQYAVGDSLDVLLRERGPMPMHEVVALVQSLAGAIDHAAARGVHHGALHLRDIVVEGDGVHVTGFGIVEAVTKVGARRPTRPQYSSPDGASDVYSLGAIAFEAVTGKRVSPDNLADFERQYGVELRSAFSVALATDPQMRPERAGDFAAVLGDAAEMTAEAERNTRHAIGADRTYQTPVPSEAPGQAEPPAALAEPVASFEPVAAVEPSENVQPAATAEHATRATTMDDFELRPQPTSDPDALSHHSLGDPLTDIDAPLPDPLQPYTSVITPTVRRGMMPVVLVAFLIVAALSVGFFLRSPGRSVAPESESGVAETTVEIPGSKTPEPTAAPPPAAAPRAAAPPAARPPAAPAPPPPAPPAAAPRAAAPPSTAKVERAPATRAPATPAPATRAPATRAPATPAPSTPLPAPAPSRAASGAVRRPQTGSLLVRSTPADADVFVNGRARGKTPMALRDLTLGSYTIRVARDGYAAEERTFQLTAERPSQSTPFDLRSTQGAAAAAKAGPGALNVQSRPAGARVFINDRPAGSTPVAIPDLPAGPATVRIELDGYEPWITSVRVNAGDQTRVAASLERTQSQ